MRWCLRLVRISSTFGPLVLVHRRDPDTAASFPHHAWYAAQAGLRNPPFRRLGPTARLHRRLYQRCWWYAIVSTYCRTVPSGRPSNVVGAQGICSPTASPVESTPPPHLSLPVRVPEASEDHSGIGAFAKCWFQRGRANTPTGIAARSVRYQKLPSQSKPRAASTFTSRLTTTCIV